MRHFWTRESARQLAALVVPAVVAIGTAGCGSDRAATGGPSPVPPAEGAAVLGCIDEAGSMSATASQRYLSDGGGAIEFGHQPVDEPGPEFLTIVTDSMTAALPDLDVRSGDYGQEATAPGGCATDRWVDLYDGQSHSYFVWLWRPETRVDLTSVSADTEFRAEDDAVIVGDVQRDPKLQDGIVVLAVGEDGTTIEVECFGTDLPATDDLIDAARRMLDGTLASRSART